MEEYRSVYYDRYEVSNLGNVRSKKTGRMLKIYKNKKGYLSVVLSKKMLVDIGLWRLYLLIIH
jgi:hypothetical protein